MMAAEDIVGILMLLRISVWFVVKLMNLAVLSSKPERPPFEEGKIADHHWS
jgi:hypothetical protein